MKFLGVLIVMLSLIVSVDAERKKDPLDEMAKRHFLLYAYDPTNGANAEQAEAARAWIDQFQEQISKEERDLLKEAAKEFGDSIKQLEKGINLPDFDRDKYLEKRSQLIDKYAIRLTHPAIGKFIEKELKKVEFMDGGDR